MLLLSGALVVSGVSIAGKAGMRLLLSDLTRSGSAILALAAALGGRSEARSQDAFHEKLTFRPLPTGQLSYQFHFTIDFASLSSSSLIDIEGSNLVTPFHSEVLGTSPPSSSVHHSSLAPLSLLLPLERNGAKEVHLSIVAGKWREDWGSPIGNEVGGTGGETRAWFLPGYESVEDTAGSTMAEVEKRERDRLSHRWTAVTNALAGLFCSSLGQITKSTTASPTNIFHPLSSLPDSHHTFEANNDMHLLHAHLPSESLCTENLTPFLKLLPSKGLSGLSGLMRPYTLLSHGWHGMGISVVFEDVEAVDHRGEMSNEESLIGRGGRVEMWWEGVVDVVDWKKGAKRDFSLTSIFHRRLPRQCPVATTSKIILIGDPGLLSQIEADQPEGQTTKSSATGTRVEKIWDYNVGMVGKDLAFRFAEETSFVPPPTIPQMPISFSRRLIGINQIDGSIKTVVRNNLNVARKVIYAEELPWYMKLWISEIKVEERCGNTDASLVSRTEHIPAVERERPTSLDMYLILPAKSEVTVTIPFSKAFIRYTDHPPDASRGFDSPPAILYLVDAEELRNTTDSSERPRQRLYSSKLLLHLAEPDFSMPYNTNLISCTLVALFFGSVFNLLVRRFGLVYASPAASVGAVKGS